MIALVPIFISDNDTVWKNPEGRSIIFDSLKAALNSYVVEKAILTTNDKGVFNIAKSLSIESYFLSEKYDEQIGLSFLPAGTDVSIDFINDKLQNNNLFIIINFRNPLLTSQLIADAYDDYIYSNHTALLSVKKSFDHPCQLISCYKILDAGLIHLLDEKSGSAHYFPKLKQHYPQLDEQELYLSRPFYFDWKARGIFGFSSFYVKEVSSFIVKYIPIEESHFPGRNMGSFPIFVYENQESARIICSLSDLYLDEEQALYGIVINSSNQCNPIYKHRKNNEFEIMFINGAESGELLFECKTFGQYTVIGDNSVLLSVNDSSGVSVPLIEEETIAGIVYMLLKHSTDSDYDIKKPFKSDLNLWHPSKDNCSMINAKTGKEIRGRQGFPEIFEPDGTFLIINGMQFSYCEQLLRERKIGGFFIDNEHSTSIWSEIDYLQYSIKKRQLCN